MKLSKRASSFLSVSNRASQGPKVPNLSTYGAEPRDDSILQLSYAQLMRFGSRSHRLTSRQTMCLSQPFNYQSLTWPCTRHFCFSHGTRCDFVYS